MWSVVHFSVLVSRSEHRRTVRNCRLSASIDLHYLPYCTHIFIFSTSNEKASSRHFTPTAAKLEGA
jgi:hypothetical protein